jgi:hypothetical protein
MGPREHHLPLNLLLTLILSPRNSRYRDEPSKASSVEGRLGPTVSQSPSQSRRYCLNSFTDSAARLVWSLAWQFGQTGRGP